MKGTNINRVALATMTEGRLSTEDAGLSTA